ncbi:hypothetical protein CQW23_09498 [Capsicum baccatum]|uniref:Uncharacterized protein n=1 Tax=Capsicum baccatum TaxID=33114 RepID=A0A2G2WX32_CAPBA|nr:hypothetical protein CQW23_09498 [Capsicum baccatum]
MVSSLAHLPQLTLNLKAQYVVIVLGTSGSSLYCFRYGISKAVFYAQVRGTCTLATTDSSEDFAIYYKTGYNLHFGTRGRGASGQVAALSITSKAPVISTLHSAWAGYILLSAASTFGGPGALPIGITFTGFPILFMGMSLLFFNVFGQKNL